MATTVWATLSAIVGTPSTLTPGLCGLGISTALTGGGNQAPNSSGRVARGNRTPGLPQNRVEARLALTPPTPPGMRVRTGRFAQHSRKPW